ncbi:hypothetical protein FRB96_008135 [Tulasnella sp. 330]|nr:hypothetical protein FRB96_008135 [Tulasnella sp. 330]
MSTTDLLQTQPPAGYFRKLANPGPLGLFSFASTTFILSLFNMGARDITTPNLIVGMAFGVGGFVQLLAGMWEFACAFSSYGGFWISFALIFLPGSGILTAYTDAGQLHSALGIYLMAWFTFTFIMFLGTFRSSAALVSVFFFLTITFGLLGAAELSGHAVLSKWGGAFGLITAACAYYTGAAGLYATEGSTIQLPILPLSRPRY